MSINLPEGSSASTATSCFPVQAGKEMLIFISENNMEDIFPSIEELIRYIDKTQDHFTIMKFTTHWKAIKGTPCLDEYGRAEVDMAHSSTNPRNAIMSAMVSDAVPFDKVEQQALNNKLETINVSGHLCISAAPNKPIGL